MDSGDSGLANGENALANGESASAMGGVDGFPRTGVGITGTEVS